MHNLDESKGFAAFYSHREVPWHELGTVTEDALTADQALTVAGLDFEVEKQPAGYMTAWDDFYAVDGQFATVRTDTGAPLGIVGRVYRPIQNAEAFAFTTDLLDNSDVKFETAGAIDGGRKVFMSLAMGGLVLDPNGSADRINNYLGVVNSHDGSSPLVVVETPVRMVCQNTVGAALRAAKRKWTVRHSTNYQTKMEEARRTLGLHVAYMDEFSKEATALIQTEITNKQFDDLMKAVWPEPDKQATDKVWETWTNRRDLVGSIYADSPTNANIRGTAWAAEQAVVEYLDWYVPVRPNGSTEGKVRGKAALLGSWQPEKDLVHSRLLALTGIGG